MDAQLTNEAVAMLKQGLSPEAIVDHLLRRGVDAGNARAAVDQLVALKRQAEALDPKVLREGAMRLLEQGAPPEIAVQHLVRAGVAEAYARPEVDRLVETLRQRIASMRPCSRCRAPSPAQELYFDPLGNQVCSACHGSDQIAAGEQRVEDARLEAAGVSPLAIQENNRLQWCPRCQDHSAVLLHATHTMARGMTMSARTFQCTRCGAHV